MSLWHRIDNNLKDLQAFGPGMLVRHARRLRGAALSSVKVPGVGDVFFRNGESDLAAIRQVFIDKGYELGGPAHVVDRIAARYRDMLAAGEKPIIVDAGANIGAASLWFATRYPEAKVVAVEPHPGNAAVLRKNLEGRANAVVMEAAIGCESGHVQLVDEGMGWAVKTERASSGLPVVTLDDAFAASGGDTPFIVKIDIEGFERDLFSANLDWLARTYVVCIELHDWMLPGELSSHNVQKAIAQHPFELFMCGENIFYVRV